MSIRKVWKTVKKLAKSNRQLLVIVPNMNYMMELLVWTGEDSGELHITRSGPFGAQLSYADRRLKVMVGKTDPTEMVCRLKEQLMGRRDQDVAFIAITPVNPSVKHEMQCLSSTFGAHFSMVVDK